MSRYVEVRSDDLADDHRCVGCGVDVQVGQGHARSCPVVTDVWVVGPREVAEEFTCAGCGRPFELGECFTGRLVQCLGCAVSGSAGAT